MLLFGLTGGIASGKSTVARYLRARGIAVIDADQVARDVVSVGSEGLDRVVAAFGPDVVDARGELDRKLLAGKIFADPALRKQLDGILHPLIAQRTAELARGLAAQGERLACYEAALLIENGLADAFRPLIVVAAPADVQVERCMARDGLSREDAQSRIRAQLPLSEKIAVADFVIDNSASREDTERQAEEVLRAIEAAAAQGSA